ncbi:unnamed protein product, partial [Haemonchus placei]|uniref:Pecanex-like protein n=1 Tax=Haemonchus placei TaxID=6290 RepID=A0A0N4WQG3_HAEPC
TPLRPRGAAGGAGGSGIPGGPAPSGHPIGPKEAGTAGLAALDDAGIAGDRRDKSSIDCASWPTASVAAAGSGVGARRASSERSSSCRAKDEDSIASLLSRADGSET